MKRLIHCANKFRVFSVLATTPALEPHDCVVKPVSPPLDWLTAIQNVALGILKFQFPRSKKTLIVSILAISQFIVAASASTHYISASGGSDSNAGTAAAPWATFDHAWTGMSSGDTLIVKNGTYKDWLNPPVNLSGTAGAYTTVQAETPWGVTVDGSTTTPQFKSTLYLYALSYFQVVGIKFASGPALTGGQEPVMVNDSNHIKLLKVAGFNAPCNNNTAVIDVTNSSYVLVEDSHAWGCGRYKFLAYQSHNVIFRHNVARHDSAEVSGGVIQTWGRQCAQYVMYDSTDILMQNNIAVDSGEADGSTGNLYGGIWSENNAAIDNSGKYEGDIFINLKTGTGSCCENGASINDPKLIGTREISNVAIINSNAGFWGDRIDGSSIPASLLLHHLTLANITGSNPGSGNAADGVGATESNNSNFTTKILKDSILQHDNAFGIAEYMASDHNIFFNNTANFGTVSYQGPIPASGANDRLNINPLLKYPVRVEAGTPGSGTASDGGDVGATILFRIGTPGTLYGDAGYDTLTTIPLWPWDDEAAIKADMAAYTGQGASGTRGFAAPGNGLYGGPITLTSYIWESLGNACPTDVCTTGTGTTPGAAAPIFTPAPGTYSSAQSVSISDTTAGAVIYYTTDGSAPTTSSAEYSGSITVSSTETVKAIAAASGFSNSVVATAAYTINLGQAATPTFSPAAGTYTLAQSVTISSVTPSSTIYYTTNGATPTTSSPVFSGPITVSTTETLKAIAVGNGFSDSAVATAAYTVNASQAATPTFSPAAGTYTSTQSVAISSTTPSSTIHYTTDGSMPTTSSPVFSGPITVASTETLKAIAVGNGSSNSAVATAAFTINLAQAAAPAFSPAAGAYTSAQTVTISSSTPSATIYYTTNGSTPSASSAVYSGPIAVSASETIKAIATAGSLSNSAVATAAYSINSISQVATPAFTPAPGTYTSAQTVTISSSTPSVTIHYTTDGTTPTVSSAVYSGPIAVSSSETIEAFATANGLSNSSVATAAYTINVVATGQAATPTFTPQAGTYASAQSVTIASVTPSATIYYTTNGTTPTVSSAVYSGPIAVSSSETIEAIATANGLSNSSVATAAYTIDVTATSQAATPTFTPQAGAYASAQSVTIASATPSATIYYTTNGTTPTTSSAVYIGPITVSSTETLEAIASANGSTNSSVATAAYTINRVASDFAVSSSPGSLTVSSAQPGAVMISIVPVNGFNSAVALVCTGLPAGTSCTFSQPLVVAANAPASTTLTVSMTSTSLAKNSNSSPLFPGSALAVALCCISLKKRRRLQMLLLLLISVTGLTVMNGCGGASFVTNASHAAVVSPVTVIGTSGALQHSTTITVTMK
jgi:hypothetical protein